MLLKPGKKWFGNPADTSSRDNQIGTLERTNSNNLIYPIPLLHRMMRIIVLFILAVLCMGLCHEFKFPGSLKYHALVNVTDVDGTFFTVRQLPRGSLKQVGSCYEMTQKGKRKQFCYPLINIVGMERCGTSSLFMLLSNNDAVVRSTKTKEFCPEHRRTIYEYLSNFVKPLLVKDGKLHVNACVNISSDYLRVHKMLAPVTTSLMIVRAPPERLWSLYNTGCSVFTEKNCTSRVLSPDRVYRSPEMFDEYLRSANFPLGRKLAPSCADLTQYYSQTFNHFTTVFGAEPFVVSLEALVGRDTRQAAVQRINEHINERFNTQLALRTVDFTHANSGNKPGFEVVDKGIVEDGLYDVSRRKPILCQSVKHILDCWKECDFISQVTEFKYTCEPSAACAMKHLVNEGTL